MNCCINCFNNTEIKDNIIKQNNIGDCDFCGSVNINICDTNSDLFFEARIIINTLNNNQRGFEIQRFTTKQIDLFNDQLSPNVLNELLLRICDFLNPEDLDKRYAMPYELSRLVRDWRKFKNIIKFQNRFGYGIPDQLLDALKYILKENKYRIGSQEYFYRARLGYNTIKEKESYDHLGEEKTYTISRELPFSPNEIMAPPPTLVTEGRLNPRGISYLYIAEDIQTAIAEVRPHKNKKVSVARVVTKEPIEVSCFDNMKFFNINSLREQIDLYLLTNYLNEEFSNPVDEDIKYLDYLPTQYVSELAKNLGIEGIRYSSSLQKGYNVCIFAKDKVDFDDSGIAKVSSVNLSIEEPDFFDV